MEIHSSSLEWNVRNLMLSLLHVAFGEIESNIMTGAQQVLNCKEIELTQNNREVEEETNKYAPSIVLEDVNNSECNYLTEALHLKDENETINTDDDECAAFYKSVRDAEYNKLVKAYDKEKIIKEEKVINLIAREQEKVDSTEVISTTETIDADECADFYKSVRDAEYNKLVEAYDKEKIIKEEKERTRITREQEKIKKQFEEFWKPAADIDSLRHVSHKPNDSKEKACASQQYLHLKVEPVETRQTGPFLSTVKEERVKSFVREQHYNYQSFQSTDVRNAPINIELDTAVTISETVPNKRGSLQRIVNKVFKRSKPSTKDINDNQLALKEELKLDLSTLDDITEDEDIPDTSRTSDSEWFSISLSDTEETPRPHLRPFFSPLVEGIHVSTITSKTKKSAKEIEIDFQSKPSSGFMGFRQWFCQLFCCHSKPDEDVDHCI